MPPVGRLFEDIMESRVNQAVERKHSGRFNCAQAVACAYCDMAGADEEMMYRVAGAFGVGMGNMEGTCGALVGAGIVLGMAMNDRVASMQAMRRVMTKFRSRNGSTCCKDLKGVETRCVLRECNDCVADAAEFLEEELG